MDAKNIALSSDKQTELYDAKNKRKAPTDARLIYRGGPLLRNVEVFTVFVGDGWKQDDMQKINDFLTYAVTSDVVDMLAEYSVPGQDIGRGTFVGTYYHQRPIPSPWDDSQIAALLNTLIQERGIPQPTSNMLYFVYAAPGITVTQGGDASCSIFCGYHSNQGQVYYAVLPAPTCDGCLGGLSPFDALTATSTHELCEAITDPVPGQGWYDDTYGEIGDIAAWQFRTSGAYTVQLEWSNLESQCK